MSILSELTQEDIVNCVRLNDPKTLEKVPGIGAKTARKLIFDLHDKIAEHPELFVVDAVAGQTADAVDDSVQDAVDALITLGFSKREAHAAVEAVAADNQSTNELLRLALASMG